jgi:hypothetical protein
MWVIKRNDGQYYCGTDQDNEEVWSLQSSDALSFRISDELLHPDEVWEEVIP